MPDDVVLDWHRKGWLALVLFHLASLDRFVDLLALEGTSGADIAPVVAASDVEPVDA